MNTVKKPDYTTEEWCVHSHIPYCIQVKGDTDVIVEKVYSTIVQCEPTDQEDSDGRTWRCSGTRSGNARRIVACVNAMKGVPDPAAFMKAVNEFVSVHGSGFNLRLNRSLGSGLLEDQTSPKQGISRNS